MTLLPIFYSLEENSAFVNHPDCQEYLPMTIAFFQKVGYQPPWIGYYAQIDKHLVGACAFKGAPKHGKVEISYGTFPQYRQQGMASEICRMLVELALKTEPAILVTARTLPEYNFSTRVLQRNGFELAGTVQDEEDGEVWEWMYRPK